MELEELIENTLRRKHLEEMMDRPEKEHTPLEGMDDEQIKRFALFLFEENQKKLLPIHCNCPETLHSHYFSLHQQ